MSMSDTHQTRMTKVLQRGYDSENNYIQQILEIYILLVIVSNIYFLFL